MLCMLLAALDQTVIIPAVPAIARDLHSYGHLAWIVTAYLLTSTAATPIFGKLSDTYGRRALIIPAIAIFVVASALCAISTSLPELILFRGLQGIGGGGLFAMAQAAIADVGLTAGTRPLSGLSCRHLGLRVDRWAGDRRVCHGQSELALGVLGQPAAWAARDLSLRPRAAPARRGSTPQPDRRGRRRPADLRHQRAAADVELGWHCLSLDLRAGTGPGSARPLPARRACRPGMSRPRPAHATTAVRQ